MKKLLVVLLMLSMILSACTKKKEEEVIKEKTQVRLGVLKGPTGIGATYLMEENENDEALNKYEITLASEATEIVSLLASNSLDIAAVPINVAASLYNKMNGGVKMIALNTAGVLYIGEKGNSINAVTDLKGKTIYAVGQGANPEYILNYILESNGLKVNEDVFVEFLDSAELVAKAASGEIEVCMLPVPAITTVLVKNSDMRLALDLTSEWQKLNNGSILTMGCIVVRDEFLKDNEEAINNFLEEYNKSINNVKINVDHASELCEKYEIVANAAIAKKAIPNSNLIFVAGAADMKDCIEGYYEILFNADPKSIGGAIPKDDFYK